MATEILLNDGGAPARILPFLANGAITGGYVVEPGTTAGDVEVAAAASVINCGVALVDAADNGPANIISGHGVILNIMCTGTVAAGDLLVVSSTAGVLTPGTAIDIAAAGTDVAIAIAAQGDTLGLVKCIMR